MGRNPRLKVTAPPPVATHYAHVPTGSGTDAYLARQAPRATEISGMPPPVFVKFVYAQAAVAQARETARREARQLNALVDVQRGRATDYALWEQAKKESAPWARADRSAYLLGVAEEITGREKDRRVLLKGSFRRNRAGAMSPGQAAVAGAAGGALALAGIGYAILDATNVEPPDFFNKKPRDTGGEPEPQEPEPPVNKTCAPDAVLYMDEHGVLFHENGTPLNLTEMMRADLEKVLTPEERADTPWFKRDGVKVEVKQTPGYEVQIMLKHADGGIKTFEKGVNGEEPLEELLRALEGRDVDVRESELKPGSGAYEVTKEIGPGMVGKYVEKVREHGAAVPSGEFEHARLRYWHDGGAMQAVVSFFDDNGTAHNFSLGEKAADFVKSVEFKGCGDYAEKAMTAMRHNSLQAQLALKDQELKDWNVLKEKYIGPDGTADDLDAFVKAAQDLNEETEKRWKGFNDSDLENLTGERDALVGEVQELSEPWTYTAFKRLADGANTKVIDSYLNMARTGMGNHSLWGKTYVWTGLDGKPDQGGRMKLVQAFGTNWTDALSQFNGSEDVAPIDLVEVQKFVSKDGVHGAVISYRWMRDQEGEVKYDANGNPIRQFVEMKLMEGRDGEEAIKWLAG